MENPGVCRCQKHGTSAEESCRQSAELLPRREALWTLMFVLLTFGLPLVPLLLSMPHFDWECLLCAIVYWEYWFYRGLQLRVRFESQRGLELGLLDDVRIVNIMGLLEINWMHFALFLLGARGEWLQLKEMCLGAKLMDLWWLILIVNLTRSRSV
jgi:hypothetical protein